MDKDELEATIETALNIGHEVSAELARMAQELAAIRQLLMSVDLNLYQIGSIR